MAAMSGNVLRRLRELVGTAGVIDPARAREPYLHDVRGLYRGEAALVLRPRNTAEVAAVLALCHREGLGVVPQGGNTGYCGGAIPDSSGTQVLLSLSRLNRVREIDATGMTATVDAGVVLARVQRAVEDEGLLFPLSMGSEGSCQIGGNLSTNAGGLAVLRYGTCRDLALGLEVVLPDGSVIEELKGLRKDNTGYDVKQLFIGAEGTLGVITGAVLKLFPAHSECATAWLAVPDPGAACRLLARARRISGDSVTSFEYIGRRALELVRDALPGMHDPLDRVYPHYVLLEMSAALPAGSLRGASETVLTQGMEAGEVLDGVLAESEAQRRSLWNLRESIPEAEKRAGGSIKHDVAVRIAGVERFLQRAGQAVEALASCRISAYGHIGDGNVHFNVLAPADVDGGHFRSQHAHAISEAVHALAAEMQGSFSAEHGVGQLKLAELARFKDPQALAVMQSVKRALDPHGIMNPGKVIARLSPSARPA